MIHSKFASIYVQVYNPQKDAWHIAYREEITRTLTTSLLTVQDDTLYMVSFGFTNKGNVLPNVKKMEINFACNGGADALCCECVDVVDLGDARVVPESRGKAFRINDKAFVSKGHAFYQIDPQIDSEGEADYQLDRKWKQLCELDKAAIVFSFDKRCLSSKVNTPHGQESDTDSDSKVIPNIVKNQIPIQIRIKVYMSVKLQGDFSL